MPFIAIVLACLLSATLGATEQPPAPVPAPANGQPAPIPQMGGLVIDEPPFRFSDDVGATDQERRAYAVRILKPMLDTAVFFRSVYKLRDRAFDDFADHFSANHFEKPIRIAVWQNRDSFLENYQARYRTKSIPGAFFGVSPEVDAYGKPSSTWIREIGLCAQDSTDQQVLREAYHEMGHLFMHTYMMVGVEIPSWIEEGTAELFQYRIGNGTHPEAERLQRLGWLREVLEEKASIPWPEFTRVHNMDNLDFTWKDPLRSQLQYLQAWSVIEFMLATPERANAFLGMLAEYRKRAQADEGALAQGPKERLDTYIYDMQEEVFKKAYGAELLKIEPIWQAWVEKTYDGELKHKPAVRYHRGEWALMRARFSKDLERNGHFARAETIFRECIDKAPDQPEGWIGLGRLALARGQHDNALEQFAIALGKGPANTEAQLYGGIARILHGAAASAVAPLAKVVIERPKGFEPHFWYGVALTASRGDTSLAVNSFVVAGAAEPGSSGKCSWWEGVANLMSGRAKEARQAFTRAYSGPGAPDDVGLWLAMAQAMEGSKADAIDTIEKSVQPPAGDALHDRLVAGKALPAITFDEQSQPRLDPTADFVPVPWKGKPSKNKKK